jgi:hypothetical protein
MKATSLVTAFSIAISAWAAPAVADPWKDESGHGRWERKHKEKDWKKRRHYREHRRDHHGSDIYIEIRPAYRPAPSYRSAANAHVQWCYSHYRSYREWDNSYQPYGGPRQPCYSPYN